jgi:hypothetical protein
MVDAKPDGHHMTFETYFEAVSFSKECGLPLIMLSGGEPSEHPELLDFVTIAVNRGLTVTILSNGEFLWTKPRLRSAILPLVHSIQVTNDDRFYPRKIDEWKHEKICWVDRITHLVPQGRAKDRPDTNCRAPECFNMRSLARSGLTFQMARLMLVKRGRFCTPSINVDGTISAGESPFCAKIGTVTDGPATAMNNLSKMTCSKCGLVDNLSDRERQAIGEH